MAFYEPGAVFLATLTLWAYSYYTSKTAPAVREERRHDGDEPASGSPSRQSSPTPAANHTEREESCMTPEPDPTFIRLDRPCDDEMVQFFVRAGRPSSVRAYITGVGDVCAKNGPARILREGRKILGSVSMAWGRNPDHVSILEAFERAMSGRRSSVANSGMMEERSSCG